VTPWGSPARGAPVQGSAAPERRDDEVRAVLLGRSVAAPLLLAFTTVAAVAGAVLALLPAALRRRPAGRLAPRRVAAGRRAGAPGDRLGDDAGARAQPASEPLSP
jgi:hypothetical protein